MPKNGTVGVVRDIELIVDEESSIEVLFGLSVQQLRRMHPRALLAAGFGNVIDTAIRELQDGGKAQLMTSPCLVMARHANGSVFPALIQMRPLFADANTVGIYCDCTFESGQKRQVAHFHPTARHRLRSSSQMS